MSNFKKIILVDFDGVIHSYTSGWKGTDVIPDPPVPGAIDFLICMIQEENIEVCIYSARSKEASGRDAMKKYLKFHIASTIYDEIATVDYLNQIRFPTEKPAAFLTLDDRCICFRGTFPSKLEIDNFKAWNK